MTLRILAILILGLGSRLASAAESVETIHRMIEEAEPGSVLRIPPATYEGNLRITKSIALTADHDVTIDGLGKGIVVQIEAPDVTLDGLIITGSAQRIMGEPSGVRALTGPVTIQNCVLKNVLFGVDLRGASDSIIRSNTISGYDFESGRRGDGVRLWWSHNCIIEDNEVNSIRDMVFWYSENLHIRRNSVTDSRYGLHCMYSHKSVFENNHLSNNSVGIYLMYSNDITLQNNQLTQNRGASGYGIGLKDCDNIVVRNNSLMANRVGLYIDNSPSSIDSLGLIETNSISFNEIGMLMTPNTHDVAVTGNGFVENEEQVGIHGSGNLSLNSFAHEGRGNYWTDYAGFDSDGDAIGDLPHAPVSLFESLLAREPNLRLFIHSPAQQAVEFTSRAIPEARPEPKFIDPHPLVDPPQLPLAAGRTSTTLPMLLMGSLLTACSLLALTCLRVHSRPLITNQSNKDQVA
ncbi:MAG: nitrous oxide reductase family maturation protein NosD [Planctomycetota bacterium]|jgi:nitrous oxidase accessory protein